jgi:hypothetical protein
LRASRSSRRSSSSRCGRAAARAILSLALLALPARAQPAVPAEPAPAPAPATPTTVEELAGLVEAQRRLIEAQQKALAEQQEQIAAQEERLAELERRLEEARSLALTTRNELAEIQQRPAEASIAEAVEARLAEVEQTVQRVPEMAVQNLQGEFPGSFRIPGTDAALRIGGLVRMVYINSFDPIGNDDRFVTSSIPIAGSEAAGKSSRIEYSVIPSRFNIDLRTPTGVGHMRAFLEADFAGGSNHLRLRHAFGQWGDWLVGQTWSTFSDPEAEPDGIDFEGLNAISLLRQPQVRWTRSLSERLKVAIAVEEANPDLTGAVGVNQAPDLVVRVRWDPEEPRFGLRLLGEGSHIQAALLVRQLRGEVEGVSGASVRTLATTGYGLNLSGVVPAPWADGEEHRLRWAWNAGKGIGRYIADLGSLGGQDAFVGGEGDELEALPVAATYIGYEHWWRPGVRSTVTAGYVWIDNLDDQPADALYRTERFSLNLAWSPIPRLDLVVEFLWGRRINRDRQQGTAGQLQIGSTFRF